MGTVNKWAMLPERHTTSCHITSHFKRIFEKKKEKKKEKQNNLYKNLESFKK